MEDVKVLYNDTLKSLDDRVKRYTTMRHLCFILFSILNKNKISLEYIKDNEITKKAGVYSIKVKTHSQNKVTKIGQTGKSNFEVNLYNFALYINDEFVYGIELTRDTNDFESIVDEKLNINTDSPEAELFINIFIRECINARIIKEDNIINHQYIK